MGAGSSRSMPNHHIHKFIAYGHKNVAIVHKFVDMEIWHRPRAAYPGSPRLDGLIFFKLHKLVSTLLGDDATLCTSYLFFYSRKAAACFLDFVAIEKSIVHKCPQFVAIEFVAIEIIPDYPSDYPFPFKSI